ncbi:MAG TPA: ferredoxin [Acidimicrobiales bacterium]|jgi:ferredoxin|nr:ferredoxin [Acidimicrobiales bacterium]
MRVSIDLARCQGYACCVVAAPRLFALGEDGQARLLVAEVGEADEALVGEVVAGCPTQAISYERAAV